MLWAPKYKKDRIDEVQQISTKIIALLVDDIQRWCDKTMFVEPGEKEMRGFTTALAISERLQRTYNQTGKGHSLHQQKFWLYNRK